MEHRSSESYWLDMIYPKEAYDGDLFVSEGQEADGRIALHVVISASDKDRESFPEVQHWGVTVVESDPLDEDVPF